MCWLANKVVHALKSKDNGLNFHVVTPLCSLLSDTSCVNVLLNKVIIDPLYECQNAPDSLTCARKEGSSNLYWNIWLHISQKQSMKCSLFYLSLDPHHFTLVFQVHYLYSNFFYLPQQLILSWVGLGTHLFTHSLNPQGSINTS